MQAGPETVARKYSTPISIICNYAAEECAANFQEEELKCAKELLQNNKTNAFFFARALKNVFSKGRQKNINILMVGPTNCGKSFLLNLIELIFKILINPATS